MKWDIRRGYLLMQSGPSKKETNKEWDGMK
jgi:hypothetical protein